MSEPIMSHSESIEINASAETVWSLVTDMERYGEWSSENTGGYWRKNEEGIPGTGAVGDEFVGINRRGEDEWKALVRQRSGHFPRSGEKGAWRCATRSR